jgi:DNA-binding LytR/AlgR family response regulator
MNCLAIDDESPALFLMEDNIRRIPTLNLVKCCKNGFDALEVMQQGKIDLIFLDIEMPGINGLEFLQSLPVKPMVIFTTAYKKYALDGYEFDIMDYLLKPISFERFLSAVNKAFEYYNLKKQDSNKPSRPLEYFFVNAEYNLLKITVADIAYIESLKDYIKIFLVNESRPVITRISMRVMEERLPPQEFIRIHKSFIIPVSRIHSIRKSQLRVGDKDFPLSDHYRENLYKTIGPQKLIR